MLYDAPQLELWSFLRWGSSLGSLQILVLAKFREPHRQLIDFGHGALERGRKVLPEAAEQPRLLVGFGKV